jgi:DNA-binding transcriptional LysR family regulator
MNFRWDDLKLFLAVYEQGSFSGAARLLKLGQPTLSRRIAELEESTGEALFVRKSQGVELTAAGQKLLPAAQSMAEWANEAELSVGRKTYLPEGKVRISAHPGVATEFVVPLAAKIRQQHPQIQIEVLSGIEIPNLGRGEADLSLRTSMPTDADLVCLDKVSCAMRVYCSKDYAAQLPSNPTLQDLDWIVWAENSGDACTNFELDALIADFKPAFISNDFTVQIVACKAGMGAIILPQGLHLHSSLRELHELDIDLGPDATGSLYLVCHKRHRYLPKVQLMIDIITQEFELLRRER